MSRSHALPVILSLLMILSAAACGGDDDADKSKSSGASSGSSSSSSGGGRGGAGGGRGFGGFGAQETKVEVLTLGRGAIAAYHVSNGNLEAIQRAPVYSRVGELCTGVFIEEGEFVAAGDPLAKLDDVEIALTRDQAKIDLERSQQAYREAGVELERATRYLERIVKDFEESERKGTSSIFSVDDRFEAEITERKAALAEKRSLADLERAKTELEAAQYTLDNTVIRAPISGVLVSRMLDPYELVSENQELFVIADLSNLRMDVDVPESAAAALLPNAPQGPNDRADSDGQADAGSMGHEMDVTRDEVAPAGSDATEMDVMRDEIRDPGPRSLTTPALQSGFRSNGMRTIDLSRAKTVILAATAFPDDRFLGYVEAVSPIVDGERGMLTVRVRVIPPINIGQAEFEPLLAQLPVLERKAVLKTRSRVLIDELYQFADDRRNEVLAGIKPVDIRRDGEGRITSLPDATLANIAQSVPAAHNRLRPGMWLEASIVTHYERDALLVPTTAVLNNTVFQVKEVAAGGGPAGVVVPGRGPVSREGERPSAGGTEDAEAKKSLRAVEVDLTGHVGVTSEGYLELKEGAPLKAGDVIVVRGQEGLKDGNRVRIVGDE